MLSSDNVFVKTYREHQTAKVESVLRNTCISMLVGSSFTTVSGTSCVDNLPCKSLDHKLNRLVRNSFRYLDYSWFIGCAEVEQNYHLDVHLTQNEREDEVVHVVCVMERVVWFDLMPQGWY